MATTVLVNESAPVTVEAVGAITLTGDDAGTYTYTGGGAEDYEVIISGRGAPYDGTYIITNTGDPAQIGYVVEPFTTGTSAVGDTRTLADGIIYSEGSGAIVETVNILRGVTTVASGVTLPYNYTILAGDDDGGVRAEISLTNGTNTINLVIDVVVNANVPAVVQSASVSPTILTNPDGDGIDYDLYEFNTAGAHTVTFSASGKIASALWVQGGDSGKTRRYSGAGAQQGGDGGIVHLLDDIPISSGSYTITVGAGGAQTADALGAESNTYNFGTHTTALAVSSNDYAGTIYAKGGRFEGTGTGSGGGAGAGGDGATSTAITAGGNGGIGRVSSITGAPVSYGIGGGGSATSLNATYITGLGRNPEGNGMAAALPTAGKNGFGDGGGSAAGWDSDPARQGAKGGDGTFKMRIAR